MLRLLVLLLLLANGAYFAWSQGLLRDWGLAPVQQAEPQRLQQQVHPERLRIAPGVSPPPPAPAASPVRGVRGAAQAVPVAPSSCLQAGLFDEAQAASLRTALASLPAGSWSLDAGGEGARWIVYMGRYPSEAALERKRNELRGLKLRYEALVNPALEPGLSLGVYGTEAAASAALESLRRRGVRTARVLQERPGAPGYWLRLPQADAALRARVEEFRGALAGKPLRPCS